MTELNSTPKLTPRQQRGILGLLSTGTITEAAALAKVNRTALHRWLRDPNFCAELEAERKRMADGLRDKFIVAANKAIDELQKIVEKSDDDRKIKAAAIILRPLMQQIQAVNVQQMNTTNPAHEAWYGSDDELYDLLRRKREAGHGIDIESIGHDVAGLAEAIPQNRGQAKQATPASAGLSRQEGSLIGGKP